MEIHARELRVVVEHLLEVRHQPACVGGVSMEAPAELVADPAVAHLHQREADHGAGRAVAGRHAPQHVFERHRLRELGRPAPRPIPGIEPCVERRVDRLEEVAIDDDLAAGRSRSAPVAPAPRRDAGPRRSPRSVASATPPTPPRGPGGTTACRAAARPGSTCRRRTAAHQGSGTPTSASRHSPSSPGRRPCRSNRGRAAPRGRP